MDKSGRIWLADGIVHYQLHDFGCWQIHISEIRLLGEYTTDHGPFLDDWFLVFVTASDDSWYEASFYAEGRHEFLPQLADLLGIDSAYGALSDSTEFASRIIWPMELRDKPLFEFATIPIPWWRRVFRFGMPPIQMELSPEAVQFAVKN